MRSSLGYLFQCLVLVLTISTIWPSPAMALGDFSVSATPNSLTVSEGVLASSVILVGSGVVVLGCADYRIAATSDPVGLSFTLSREGFCVGTNQQAASTLTINSSGASPGTYAVTVTVGLCASSRCDPDKFSLKHSASISVVVPSYHTNPAWWSGWASLGGLLTSNVALGNNASGGLEVFVRGTDNALWHIYQVAPSDGWSNWESLGGVLTGDPSVGQNADGRLEVFVRGTDNGLWHIYQVAPNAGWSGWQGLGKPTGVDIASLAAARNQDGRLQVFAIGTDRALWHIYQAAPNSGWANWAGLGIPTGVSLFSHAVGQNRDGRLEVFAIGGDRTLWHIYQVAPSAGWSGWNRLGGGPALDVSPPTVGRNQDGRLEVFARDTSNGLQHIYQVAPNDGWSSWGSLGGVLTSNIGLVNDAGRGLEIFARGTDSALWHIYQVTPNDGWSGWDSLGGVVTSDPAPSRNADGRLEVFVRGTDNGLWHNWRKMVKASDVFFEANVHEHHDPRNIIARDIVIAGWLRDDPSGNWPEDFHYDVVPDPDYLLDPNINPTLGALQSAVLPGNGLHNPLDPSTQGPTQPLTFQDLIPGGPSQRPCWEQPCVSRGITLNSFLIPGNTSTYHFQIERYLCQKDHPSDPECWPKRLQTPYVHVELNAWNSAYDGPKPDPTWVQDKDPAFPYTFWAYDPFYPDKAQPSNPGRELKAGDYVVMRGTLWQDAMHHPAGSGFCQLLGGFFCGSCQDPNTCDLDQDQQQCWDRGPLFGHGGWIEMHPPDSIIRTPQRNPQVPRKTVAALTVCAPVEAFDRPEVTDLSIRPLDYTTGRYTPRPSPTAKLRFAELIDGRFTDMRNVDEHIVTVVDDDQDPHIAVHVKVHSSGTLSIQAREGRFKAVYIVWWE